MLLSDVDDPAWIHQHHPGVALPVEQVLWTRDGVACLAPQVQLLHEARATRAEDTQTSRRACRC